MFILLAGALALVTAAALALPFLRQRGEEASRAAYDAQTYRAQLAEVEQDVTRGVLTEAEAKSAKVEISRRLLTASDTMEREDAPDTLPAGSRSRVGIAAALAIPLAAAALYLAIGSAGRPDMPLETRTDYENQMAQRPSQSRAETILARSGYAPEPQPLDTPELQEVGRMVEQVKAVLERRPDDATGRRILARTEARLGRHADAWRNYRVLLDRAAQPDVDLLAEAAESMISATNGYVSPEAEALIDRGLSLDPREVSFRHYKAVALVQGGRDREALDRWTALLQEAKPGTPWAPMVHDYATATATRLGLPAPPLPAAPEAAPGPTREQVAAAQEMSGEDRAAMIEGMVAGLAARLADDPDDLQGWLRLIRAYGVMGRVEDRDEALATARATFADDAEALARLDRAGQ